MKKNVQEDFNGEVTEADEAKKKVSENDNQKDVTVISSERESSSSGTIMIFIGVFLLVVGFGVIFNVVSIYDNFPFLSNFYPIIATICPILGVTLLGLGINLNKAHNLSEIMKDVELVGKKINEIESLIGEHTSIDITSNGQRLYRWEDYLELLCDKDNVCLEVLKNSIIEQKNNQEK